MQIWQLSEFVDETLFLLKKKGNLWTFLIVSSIEFPFKVQGNICIGFYGEGFLKREHTQFW